MKVWITDRWWGVDPVTKKKSVKKANFGSGARWQVSHYAEQSDGTRKLVAKNFERLIEAEALRTRTEHEIREGSYRSPQFARKTFADAATVWLDGRKRPNGASMFRYRTHSKFGHSQPGRTELSAQSNEPTSRLGFLSSSLAQQSMLRDVEFAARD